MLAQVAGALGGDEDQRGGAVVLQAAVEEPEGLHDPARGVVRLGRQRPAVHHRARVVLRVVVGGERDRALGLGLDAVVVHEAHHPHGEALGRRHEPVGEGEATARRDTVAAGGAEPKRWNWPWASARKTTTQSA